MTIIDQTSSASGRETSSLRSLAEALLAPEPSIPFALLYDETGSRIFSAITSLDEYYLPRAEQEIFDAHLPEMLSASPTERGTLIDLGAGDCQKAARLFPSLRPAHYVAIDISTAFLSDALARMHVRFPDIEMTGVGTDFSERLELPPAIPTGRRLFFYPGSSIGNFSPTQAVRFLTSVREAMGEDGALWIGVDLHKDRRTLERAYDDDLGLTAAFIRNALRHANRILSSNFDLPDWRYRCRYDEARHRVEMHLEAMHDITVLWPDGRREFRHNDLIHIEYSYKHTVEGFTELLADAGLRRIHHWTDSRERFAVFAATPA